MEKTQAEQQGSTEVELAQKVKSCRDCQWFWGAVPPYGPFPAFDWQETYPQALRDGPVVDDPEIEASKPHYWCKVEQVEGERVEPAVLRGCRKAPIMTVGINPNMTAFFTGAASTTWAYPSFKRQETYAYYYRHATIYQESFDLDDLVKDIVPGTEIRAKHDGTVYISRSDTYRWLSIEFEFSEQGKTHYIRREEAWLPEQRMVIFARDAGDSETVYYEQIPQPSLDTGIIASDIHSEKPLSQPPYLKITGIEKGDLIAARIAPKAKSDIRLFANETGYYQRAAPILVSLQEALTKEGYENCVLEIGEDISMHDMVGCASPGWAPRYNIPREWIAERCVDKNRYMFDQLIQSKPRVLLIVSGSSLAMFAASFVAMGGEIDLDYDSTDAFALLEETTRRRCMLHWRDEQNPFSSRVIVTPHFSYEDNFKPQSRLSSDAWQVLKERFADDLEILKQDELARKEKGCRINNKYHTVYIDREDDPIQGKLSEAVWLFLMAFHIAPYELIHTALLDEHGHQPLIKDKKSKHLDRAPGNCSFCVNPQWQFPEGCDYGLANELA
ncbi:hypothetical protein SAMN02745866_01217 [Alteromonadaceae bacterium Bs31]|nr:hypothetical protein SAMN02745866_01217 [Alteromonadaceae bacterium Bs31]